MKFNFNGHIEVFPVPDNPGLFGVVEDTELFKAGRILTLGYLREHFTPADCEALNLMDPDRTERLCPPVIG
uniref:Uncharacterized protein n=1 Tax=viral metagenome TaxID=1070528 RepID=A0A6M3LPK0_9ZZZZ